MTIVEKLLKNAYEDTQLLIGNDKKGDNFSLLRDIEFVMYAEDEKTATAVTGFINDNRYGKASLEEAEERFRILVVINMPSTQHLVCSTSGLMSCIASIFSLEYDGWGCTIQDT